VDVVELSPGVRTVSRWFNEYNGNVLSDPRVHLYIDDGRNYVLGTQGRYDVVQAGIIHPGLNSGNAGFYGVDFYRECKRILAPGGIVCQWLPMHSMPFEDFTTLIRSFQAEFPNTSIWFKYTSDFCILVGTAEPLRIDLAELERRVNEEPVKAGLAGNGVMNAYDLLSAFCAAGDDVRKAVGGGPLNTDDRSSVEFHCNRPLSTTAHVQAVSLLDGMRRSPWRLLHNVPSGRAGEVKAQLDLWVEGTYLLTAAMAHALVMDNLSPDVPDFHTAHARALALFDRALQLNPDDATTRFLRRDHVAARAAAVANWLCGQGRLQEAVALVESFAAGGEPESMAEAEAQYLYRLLRRRAGSAPAPGAAAAGP
jgi:hypothetical protein